MAAKAIKEFIPWFSRGIFKHFEFEERIKSVTDGSKVTHMTGKCLICKSATISGVYQCSTNFLRHVRSFHKEEYQAHIEKKPSFIANLASKKRLRDDTIPDNSDSSCGVQLEKKIKTSFFCTGLKPLTNERQGEIESEIVNYVIAEARPLHTVTRPSFRLLMRALNPRARPLSKRRLPKLISREFVRFKSSLKKKFAASDISVCLTADIWTGRNRGFLGVTAHWFDKTLKRHSTALACKRFKGSHTYDTIAQSLNAIIVDYGLQGKVTSVVTDNGSNFVKAFKVYQKQDEEESVDSDSNSSQQFDYSLSSDGSDVLPQTGCLAGDILDQRNKTTEVNVPISDEPVGESESTVEELSEESIEEGSDTETVPQVPQIVLPPHFRCVSHTLSLLATTDFDKAIQSNSVYKLAYRRVLSKLKALWNKNSRSVTASDETYKILGRYLPRPGETRWNSLFDSVRTLVAQDQQKINELLTALKIPTITNSETSFLCEYLALMAQIAISLDTLQGEKNCVLGSVLPLLVKLKEKLTVLELSNAGNSIRDALLVKIDNRFGHLFKDRFYILAAATHPKFKLNWISDSEEKRSTISKLESEITKESVPASTPVSDGDFLSFEKTVDNQCDLQKFLSNKSTNISMLSDHSEVKSLFVKYNTTIPSSAPVERLFSIASLILTARRNRLNDVLLEHLLLLKIDRKM